MNIHTMSEVAKHNISLYQEEGNMASESQQENCHTKEGVNLIYCQGRDAELEDRLFLQGLSNDKLENIHLKHANVFQGKPDFLVHEVTEPNRARFKCPDCGQTFNRRSVLINHRRIQMGEKPYKCPICGQSFSRTSILVNH